MSSCTSCLQDHQNESHAEVAELRQQVQQLMQERISQAAELERLQRQLDDALSTTSASNTTSELVRTVSCTDRCLTSVMTARFELRHVYMETAVADDSEAS